MPVRAASSRTRTWSLLAVNAVVLALVALVATRPGAGAQPAPPIDLSETGSGLVVTIPPGGSVHVDPAAGTGVSSPPLNLADVAEGNVVTVSFPQGGTITFPPPQCPGASPGRRMIRVSGAAVAARVMPRARIMR